MGEKNNDGGQFFTPREVIRAMVRAIDPRRTDGCTTQVADGRLPRQSFEWMRARLGAAATADELQQLREDTFWGREKADLIYPIALANLGAPRHRHAAHLAWQHADTAGDLPAGSSLERQRSTT